MKILIYACMVFGLLFPAARSAYAVDAVKDVSTMTKADILKMSNAELVALPLEDLIVISEKLGVSVDELLNMKVSVSSKKALSTRESPGIISIITAEEIANSGARDLVDVLRLVPGIDFAYDVQGVVGIGVRGIWGHEGKVLVMIDGQAMNELNYSTMQFGSRTNLDNIKRIEILRGPGSCVYGGLAELAVINIITNRSDDINGIKLHAAYGQMDKEFGRVNGGLEVGKFFKGGDFSLSAFGSHALRNNADYTEWVATDETETLMVSHTYPVSSRLMDLDVWNINAGLNLHNLSMRLIYDDHLNRQTQTLYDPADSTTSGEVLGLRFRTLLAEAKYEYQPNDKLTITPRVNYKANSPWETQSGDWIYHVFSSRTAGNITATYDFNDNFNILGGAEVYYDYADNDTSDYSVFPDDTLDSKLGYVNVSGFAQGLLKTKWVNFVLGGRGDYSREYGSAFSPRVGLTGLIDKFHYKTIFSKAFRAPGIENMRVGEFGIGEKVRPERTTVIELELGYALTSNMFITANLFDITIDSAIVYFYNDVTADEGYKNYGKTGSTGLELEYKLKYSWGYVTANYSYYTAQLTDRYEWFKKNTVDFYAVEGNTDALLAFPEHKVALSSAYTTGKLTLSPSLIFFSKRYSWEPDADGFNVQQEWDPAFYLNFFARLKDAGAKGLTIGAGIQNIFDTENSFLNPYQSTSWPGPGREFQLKLSYDLTL